MNPEILTASDELISAVLNGLYQGIILTLLMYLVLRFIGGTNAATRYGVWSATLFLVIAIIPAHYLRHRFFTGILPDDARRPMLPTGPASPVDLSAATPEISSPAAAAVADQHTAHDGNIGLGAEADPEKRISGLSGGGSEPEISALDSEPIATGLPNRSAEGPGAEAHGPAPKGRPWGLEQILNLGSWNLSKIAVVPRMASLGLLLAWLLVALFRAGRLLGRLCQIGKIKRAALPAGPELSNLFNRLRGELAIRRKVELKLCPVQASPIALGFFHPLILLPEEQASASAALEAEHILRHELAHVQRHDDWANLAQNFIQAGLFFHPAVWWISRRLSLEREIACDDHVLQQGAGPRAYALLLAELAGRLKRHNLVFAQGVSSSKSQLQQRINMILNTRRNTSPGLAKARLGFVTSAAALLAVLALYSAPRLVLAQSPAPAVAATTPPADNVNINMDPGDASVAVVASADEPDATPTPPATPDVGPGPKFKPGQPGPAPLLPVAPIPPSAAVAGALPVPAPAVEIAADVRPLDTPRPPGAPRTPGNGSLEERIERLEQMVQSLMNQPGAKRAHGAMILRGRSSDETYVDQKEMEKMNQKMNEMAKRQAERAQEQSERAQEQSKRAAEMAARANKDFNFKWKAETELSDKGMRKEGLEKQLEALRKAKEGLERQMENLDRQIERVERDQERMQNEQERRSELREEEPKEETPSVAEAEKK